MFESIKKLYVKYLNKSFLDKYPDLYKYFDLSGNKIYDWKTFDIDHETYFYKKNHPGDKYANVVDGIYEKIYNEVIKKCNESGEYVIDCFNGRYTVQKISEVEQIHYNAMSDEEKAKYDLEKKKTAIDTQIYEYKEYLSNTDYVITKINEVSAIGTADELEEIKKEYSEQLSKRKEAREKINELEKELDTLNNS